MLEGMAAGLSSPAPVPVLVRVSLPDRPGALGLVASRIGAVRGDIVGIDVLERVPGRAVDEFGVVLPSADLLPLLVREIEQAGAKVEDVVVVSHMPDPRRDALEAAVRLCDAVTTDELCRTLAASVGRSLLADWVAVVDPAGRQLTAWGLEPPLPETLLDMTDADSPPAGGTFVTVRLQAAGVALLAGRAEAAFRDRERAQLAHLAVVADRVWTLLA